MEKREYASQEGLPIFLRGNGHSICGWGMELRILNTKSLLLFLCHKNKNFIPGRCKQFPKLAALFQRLLVAYSFHCKDVSICNSCFWWWLSSSLIPLPLLQLVSSPCYGGTLQWSYSLTHDLCLPPASLCCCPWFWRRVFLSRGHSIFKCPKQLLQWFCIPNPK